MTICQFCDHRNPAGAVRCESCGAELPAVDESTALAPHVGVPSQEEAAPAVDLDRKLIAILASQGKIAAIKVHREATGIGLKESKEYVEALARRQNVQIAKGSGCAGVLLAACLAAVAAWCLLR